MSLAQLPLVLQKSLGYCIDFQELGYPKLKAFLQTMEDVIEIDTSAMNKACVRLIMKHKHRDDTSIARSEKSDAVPKTKNWLKCDKTVVVHE